LLFKPQGPQPGFRGTAQNKCNLSNNAANNTGTTSNAANNTTQQSNGRCVLPIEISGATTLFEVESRASLI